MSMNKYREIHKLWVNEELVYDSTSGEKENSMNMNGNYNLIIQGNTVVLVDQEDGETIETISDSDSFKDILIAIKQAFYELQKERDKPIEVGDYVQIIDNEQVYPSYVDWVYKLLSFNYVQQYQYGKIPENGTIGKVIRIDKHLSDDEKIVVAIQSDEKVYIADMSGVEKVK